MTRIRVVRCATRIAAVACVLLVAGGVLAQSGGPYDLTWNSIDGGGYTYSVGGPYALGGTVGQPDAGLMLGGDYSLAGGFWGRGLVPFRVYLPLVLRDGS